MEENPLGGMFLADVRGCLTHDIVQVGELAGRDPTFPNHKSHLIATVSDQTTAKCSLFSWNGSSGGNPNHARPQSPTFFAGWSAEVIAVSGEVQTNLEKQQEPRGVEDRV